jgi:hypothetical protein
VRKDTPGSSSCGCWGPSQAQPSQLRPASERW